jgi:hypothetical protein
MASYRLVYPKFWRTAKARAWTDEQRLLSMYLLTCEHRNTEGLFYMPLEYAAADLGWSPTDVAKWMGSLDGFVSFDPAADVVFLHNALKHQPPKSDKQVIGAASELSGVPKTTLWPAFHQAAQRFAPKLAEVLEPHSNGVPDAETTPFETSSSTQALLNSLESEVATPTLLGENDLETAQSLRVVS